MLPHSRLIEAPGTRPVQVIAVTGGKGGIGKTSVSINHATALARSGERVLLLAHDTVDWPVAFLGALHAGIVPVAVNTLLTAGVLLAVMILPTIMTLSDDALRGVSATHRLAARGLGLNTTETVFHVSIPQAAPGLLAAVLLGIGRAMAG